MSMRWHAASRPRARRYATLATGWTLIGVGGVLLFLPGPGIPLILGGLALLGREAPWARRLDHRLRARLRLARRKRRAARPPPMPRQVE